MIKLSRGAKICSIISIVLIIMALILLRPLNRKLESLVNDYAQELNSVLYEKAGISISYKTFSPSILASFKISDIKCVNKDNDDVVVIDELVVNYKLFNAIRGKYSDIIKSVKIDGAKVDIGRIVTVCMEMFQNQESEQNPLAETENPPFEFESIAQYIPADCRIKDLTLIYNDEFITSTYYVDNLNLNNAAEKQLIDVDMKGRMELLIKDIKLNVDGSVQLSGNITHNLENSTAKLTASNFDVMGFKISKQNLLVTYKNNEVEAHSIQTVNPLYIWGSYNFADMITKAGIKTDNLSPMSVFSTKDKELVDMIKDFRLSLDASIEYDILEDNLSYESSGGFYVPQKFVPDGLNVYYALDGDMNFLHVERLQAIGKLCDLRSNFDAEFANLKLDGFFDVKRFTLPNGKNISSQIYLDPLYSGFMIFAPQINIGEKTLTGLQVKLLPQNDSIDFDFEVSDYTPLTTGKIEITGSYLLSSNYAQANVGLNSLSINSIVEYVQELVDEQTSASMDGIKDFIKPYLFTGDVYVSSDLKSISYNVPYILVANTEEDNQYIFASANGNEQSVQLNRFDLIYGSYAANLTGTLDIEPESNDMFFDAELIFASIPYHLTGNIEENRISISGDYGITAFINLGKDVIDGNLVVENLPFFLMNDSYVFSTDSFFSYDNETGPQIQCTKLEIEKTDINSSINPKVSISGTGTKYGAQLTNITYFDRYSVLDGSADIKVNFVDDIFSSAAVNLLVMNSDTKEKVQIDLAASNPDGLPLDMDTIMKNMYLNANIDINNFSMSRFSSINNNNNRLTGNISLTGTLEHPYAAISLSKLTMVFGGDMLTASGNILLEDRIISIVDTSFAYPTLGVQNISGEIDLEKFEGAVNALFFMGEKGSDLKIPITIKLYDSFYTDNEFIPEIFTVTIATDDINGNLMKKSTKFDISMNYSPDFISVFSSDNIGLVGTYIPETGELFGSIDSTGITSFDIGGVASLNELNIDLSRIKIDLKKLMAYFNLDDAIKIENGILEGDFHLGGNLDTPDFVGVLSIANPKVRLPGLFDQVLSTDKLIISATGNEIAMEKFNVAVRNSNPRFLFSAKLGMNKWAVDTIFFDLKNLPKNTIPLRYKDPIFKLDGDIQGEVDFFFEKNTWTATGNIFADDVDFTIDGAALATTVWEDGWGIITDLNLKFGTHVALNVTPLLRAIFVPNTNIGLKVDTDANKYEVDGEVKLRSGDIAYLQRNFYIKEGVIRFNPEDMANPMITLRAETREKDEKGQQVRIIFSVENQYLQDLNPRFTAIPSKSEQEIMSLLGQVLKTDSDSIGEVLLSVGDYYIQSTVMSGLENKLRDLLNFDIFSVRTNFLQNTFGAIGSTQNALDSEKQTITIGNFLDNSTVYIGKYLGSALYVDGMVHLSMDDNASADASSLGNLLFKPEIGLELELPIANIRWSMSPDINALLNNEYVPSTALTLSWKFNF
ncbi:MAG: translocation/assembly module TamB [Treponema sp.]|nr:translocation/assembly module TamB [Treponema sp.]